jgi:hypothetical protein
MICSFSYVIIPMEEDLEHNDELELDDAIQHLERDDSISQP